MKFRGRIKSRIRLWAIFCELGYIPWHKPRVKKQRQRSEGEVYMGAKETIPFMDAAGKRTFVHLLLRPGYMIRDYVIRGQHDRYLAPFTALLVFFSVFTLLVAIIRPEGYRQVTDAHHHEVVDNIHISVDSTQVGTRTEDVANAVAATLREGYILIHLDQYPEAADTPWKESVAAVLGELRSKGIPLFLEGFLLLWLSLAVVLKKYKITSMTAARATAALYWVSLPM